MHKASEEVQRPCILIFGDSGIGKTTLACSTSEVPEMSPVLYLNLEDGALSIKELYPDITIINIETLRQLQSVFDDLYRKDGAGFKTVIVDNATEEQKIGLEHFFNKASSGPATDFVDFKSGSYQDQSWSWSSEQMRKSVRYFRRLPMNVIFTAWAKDFAKPNDSKPKIRPAFTPQVANEIPGLFQDIYYYYMKGNKRLLQTVTTDTCIAKDRTRKLPPLLEDPTMKEIWEYWNGIQIYTPPAPKEEDKKPSVQRPNNVRK